MKLSTLQLFRVCFPRIASFIYIREMQHLLAGCRTCLDVGCGDGSPVQWLDFDHTVGVEAYGPALERARAQNTHSEFRLVRAQDISAQFSSNQFDSVVSLDLIEHLTKEGGLELIHAMERIASRRILIFTPNGFLQQHSHSGNLQAHRSGWEAKEMEALGFRVIGMHGHSWLRGVRHEQRVRPKMFGGILSVASHYLYSRSHPAKAAALLCVKDADDR